MHTFLTPEPLTIEVRNSAGEVVIELDETTTTTVHLAGSDGHPLSFLNNTIVDDMLRAVDRWRGSDSAPASEKVDSEPGSVEADQIDLVVVQQEGNRLIVDTDPARNGLFSAFTVRISAPAGSSVRVKSQSADVGISGRADRLELRSASGDLSVHRADGAVVVQTSSGDVEVASVGGDLDLRAVSGAIDIGEVGGAVHAQTTSGTLVIQRPGGDVRVRSVSGDVEVRDAVLGRTEISTVSGDIRIGVHAGLAVKVELNSVTGNVRSDFEVADAPTGGETVTGLAIKASSTTGAIQLAAATASTSA